MNNFLYFILSCYLRHITVKLTVNFMIKLYNVHNVTFYLIRQVNVCNVVF